MHNQKIYKIGTRGSLLALTQCNQVKDQLEALTGDLFQLEIIKTRGDQITNAPLWQLDGKDFFTKELDDALLNGSIDLVVHSYKDLGSERPEGIALAAITKRTFAHDILLIKNQTINELNHKKELVVGTSSPRRIANLEKNLAEFIPFGRNIKITTKILRGNVNTRISKLIDNDYDAIVIALPGIERLALTESSCLELSKLLKNLNFMVLPQSVFPSSASQGALGIECLKNRADGNELRNKLQKLQDSTTAEEVSREREAFARYGGGCHLAVGINVKKIDNFYIHNHKGILNTQEVGVSLLEGRSLPKLDSKASTFNGHSQDELIEKVKIENLINSDSHVYVTSKHCYHVLNKQPNSLWSAGAKSMRELAALGFWVNGTSDSLGDKELKLIRSSRAISLMIDTNQSLEVLTNDESISELGKSIACYKRIIKNTISESFENKILGTEVFYWTSFPQYLLYVEKFPQIKNRIHACGLGKTFAQFKKHNIEVIPFHGMNEFKKWTNQ